MPSRIAHAAVGFALYSSYQLWIDSGTDQCSEEDNRRNPVILAHVLAMILAPDLDLDSRIFLPVVQR